MKEGSPILRAENLSRYVWSDGGRKPIIEDFNYIFESGRIYNILGPSGAGKSSLLRLFNRLDESSSGGVFLRDENIRDQNPCSLRRKIGYFFQTPYLFPGTVKDNILYANPALDDDSIMSLLSLVSLKSSIFTSGVEMMSIGEKQRVALARLLALDPEIILLDEPTSALDTGNALVIENLIRRITSEDGKTAIVVTHKPEQARRLGGEGILLIDAKLVESGPVEQIVSNPKTEQGREFINKGNDDRN